MVLPNLSIILNMTLSEISLKRLIAQKIIEPQFQSAKEVVQWLGAIQAQDYYMAKWAIGSRMAHATDQLIEDSINKGEIIRTHVMRPTWHFVPAEDIRWMLALTATHIKASIKSYQTKLGLSENIFQRTNDIIGKVLRGNNFLTRTEIVAELKKKKVAADNLQATHIMFEAELNCIVCNGPMRGKQFTYALIDERVRPTKSISREEGLYRLAKKYFTSHGPATIQDFAWWSGLSAADSKLSIELIKDNFASEKIENKVYWFDSSISIKNFRQTAPLFLPAFDEFMISYTDRSASLDSKYSKIILVGNGIFRPIIVLDGKVIGIWLRTIKKNYMEITTHFFSSKQKLKKDEIASLLEPYSKFLNLKLKI
jgi:hypothetical protein